jgi:hypothetical protein
MGLTYLFHSLGVVRVNLGDMLLPLGHLGGSTISSSFTLIFEPAREDRKGVCRCRGTWTHLFCPNPLQRSTLNNSPSKSCDNNPIISQHHSPITLSFKDVPNGFISEIPNIFLSLHSTPHDLCNLFNRTNQINYISRSTGDVFEVFPGCFEYCR